MFRRHTIFCVLVVCFFGVSTLSSQSATGRIIGTVTDATGAIVPGVSVTATNTATGVISQTLTNENGSYQLLLLPIGTYQVNAELSGFRKATSKPEKLEINQALRMDITLEVGSPAEAVSVEANAATIETMSSTLGMSISANQIANLPLNGRNSLDLALLQPGVIPKDSTSGGGTFSVVGARGDSVTYLLDGGVNNNLLSNTIVLNPNPDTIAEFRILTNNYNAEYGRNAGGIFSVVTKSGTNAFHGSAYDYVRNDALNANSFFNNANALRKDILKRNQFGGTVGGPILRDRLFFFSAWQSQRQSQLQTTSKTTVFTPAELNGDFSLSNASRTGPDANVVAFLQKFPYFQPNAALAAQGIIDPSKIHSVAKNYIKSGLIPTSAEGFLFSQASARDNRDEFLEKVDYNLTSNDRLSTTLGYNRRTQLTPYSIANVNGYPNQTFTHQYFFATNYVKTISPTVINDFRFTAQRNNNLQAVPASKQPTPQELGIGITPDEATGPTILGFSSGMVLGFSNQGPSRLIDNTFTWNDSLSWIKGAHTFKTGATFTPYQDNQVFDFFIDGRFDFRSTGASSSKNDRADLLLGLADQFRQYPAAPSNIRTKNYGTFFQDEWRLRRNLTISLGIRYEYNSPKFDTQGRTFSYVYGQKSTVFPNAPIGLLFPGDAQAPKGSNFPDKNDWAPRVGFAYSLGKSAKTSIRGGFGVFYDILKAEDNFQFNGQKPFFPTASFNFTALTSNPTTDVNYLTQPYQAANINNPFPTKPVSHDIDFAKAGFLPFGDSGVYSVDPHLRTPYIYQYNLSVQREFTTGMRLEVAYAGSDSHKLTGTYDLNPFILDKPVPTQRLFNAFPGNASNAFSYLTFFSNVGLANYNSLLVGLTQHPRELRGIGNVGYQLSYTYGKSIDTASGFRARDASVPTYDQKRFRSVSDFDLTNYVSLSGNWEVPFAKAWSSRVTKGWTLYPIFTHRSGQPLDVTAGLSTSMTQPGPSGAGDRSLVRANLVAPIAYFDPHLSQTLSKGKGNYFFDPAAFVAPANDPTLRTYGTFGRNAFRGPDRTNLDLSVAKITTLVEGKTLEFRADFFNMLNHAEFNNPSTSITGGTFGQVSATASPRIIQLALRLLF